MLAQLVLASHVGDTHGLSTFARAVFARPGGAPTGSTGLYVGDISFDFIAGLLRASKFASGLFSISVS